MAKTQWADGKHLTPAQMISFFGNTAGTGHAHSGADSDGSVPEIDLANHVTGSLSLTSIGFTENTFNAIMRASDVAGSPTPQTWFYVLLGSTVIIHIKSILEDTDSTEMQIEPVGGDWPAALIPTTVQEIPLIVVDQNARWPGKIIIPIATSTNMIIHLGDANGEYDANHFDASIDHKGVPETTIIYLKD